MMAQDSQGVMGFMKVTKACRLYQELVVGWKSKDPISLQLKICHAMMLR